jgi:hypothetical protein
MLFKGRWFRRRPSDDEMREARGAHDDARRARRPGRGLGASTALFAALDRVLFRPLSYTDPDRVVSVGVLSARTGEPFGRAGRR